MISRRGGGAAGRRWPAPALAAGAASAGACGARERGVAQGPRPPSVAMMLVWKNSRRSMMSSIAYGSAKATTIALPRRRGFARNVECRVASAGDRRDVLLAVRALIRQRRHQHIVVERRLPQLLAGLRVEGAETEVGRGADEDEPARGGDRAAVVHRRAGVENSLRRQFLCTRRAACARRCRRWSCSPRRSRTTAARCTDSPAGRRRSWSGPSAFRTTAARPRTCSTAAAR